MRNALCGADALPRSSPLHSNTAPHRFYTHVSDWILRSILKRKRSHLSIERALERGWEGEKTHSLLCKHASPAGEGSLNAGGRDGGSRSGLRERGRALKWYRRNVREDIAARASCLEDVRYPEGGRLSRTCVLSHRHVRHANTPSVAHVFWEGPESTVW